MVYAPSFVFFSHQDGFGFSFQWYTDDRSMWFVSWLLIAIWSLWIYFECQYFEMSLWKSVTVLLILYFISFAIWGLLHEGKELPLFQDQTTHSIYKAKLFSWFTNISQTKHTQKDKCKETFVAHFTFPWISPYQNSMANTTAFDSTLKIYHVNNGFLVQKHRPDPFLLLQLSAQLGLWFNFKLDISWT